MYYEEENEEVENAKLLKSKGYIKPRKIYV